MSVERFTFLVYKRYLVKLSDIEGRPFRLPKNTETFTQRNDKRFFDVLARRFKEDNIKETIKIDKFLRASEERLESFHISHIVTDYDDIKKTYESYKEESVSEKQKKIKKQFDFLIDYCIINKVKSEDDLKKGYPPMILKIWKEKKIDDIVLVSVFDLNSIKKKTWFKIYLGKLSNQFTKLLKDINTNVHLNSFIESELLRFKTVFKK